MLFSKMHKKERNVKNGFAIEWLRVFFSKKAQEDALAVVNEFIVTKLETEVRPKTVVLLRNLSYGMAS